MKFGAGESVARTEDDRLLRGAGRYTHDLALPGQAWGYVVRSPHAHAILRRVGRERAERMPGVLAVLTAAEAAADGIGPLPCLLAPTERTVRPRYAVLVEDRARHVGDAVAFVVAETEAAAREAAEAVELDMAVLPANARPERAADFDVAPLWDEAPRNICFEWEHGDAEATRAAFARAAHVVRLDAANNRVLAHAMEPRAAIGVHDPASDRYTLYGTTQGGEFLRDVLADHVLRVPRDRLRVVTPDVGGGFGAYFCTYPEQALVLWAARRLGRPVAWANDRTQSFLSDVHARDHWARAELALDADGRFLATRVVAAVNLGAHLTNVGPAVPTLACRGMQVGLYRFAAAHVSVTGVFTNTAPVDAYRGAGNPEAHHLLERLIDIAARRLAVAPDALRRRNLIAPEAIPFATVLGHTYDSGDFPQNMADAQARAGWADFPARRAEAAARGRLRGIGLANHIKPAAGAPFGPEGATIRFEPDGTIVLLSGSQSTGQGHQTSFAQMVASGLGVPFERIVVRQGDTDATAEGHGTSASRSMVVGGTAVGRAVAEVIERGRVAAGDLLETAPADLAFADGRYRVVGTDRTIALLEVAARAAAGEVPGIERLEGAGLFRPQGPTYPNGCHVCEVEIDPETGAIDLVGYTAVDDYGRVINPLILAGQVHGGIVQGIGQAVCEHVVYDPDNAQLLTASLMDYALPRADDLPPLAVSWNEHPCPSNPLGVKGGSESGCVGALPAVVNAVVDALAPYGVEHVEMPLTPQRIWRALHHRERGTG